MSDVFRSSYAEHNRQHGKNLEIRNELVRISNEAENLLCSLAVAIRRVQDEDATKYENKHDRQLRYEPPGAVGVVKTAKRPEDFDRLRDTYQPPYRELPGFTALELRGALNKIVHFDRRQTWFYADAENHDLLLGNTFDERKALRFIAVVSVLDLVDLVLSLPDHSYSPQSHQS